MPYDPAYEKRRRGTPARRASKRAYYHRRGWLVDLRRDLEKRIERNQRRLEEL